MDAPRRAVVPLFCLLYGRSVRRFRACPEALLSRLLPRLSSLGSANQAIVGGVGMLLGMDALLDMTRTGVNVFGHCTVVALNGKRQTAATS